MKLEKIECDFCVCQIKSIEQINFMRKYVFLSKTTDEISLVCETDYLPSDAVACEHGWKALKIIGVLDFNMVGVIAKISNIIANADIGIFVVSTYNTDYLFFKAENYDKAIQELTHNGYVIE